MRSLFMLKSVKRDNDDFSYTSRNIKNTVDMFIKTQLPRVLTRVILIQIKVSNDSNIQSNNNFATPADIFNRDNNNEHSRSSDICINENIIPNYHPASETE